MSVLNTKRIIPILAGLIILAAVILSLTHWHIPSRGNIPTTTSMTYPFTDSVTPADITNKQVRITTKYGDIVFALDGKNAPLAASSFVYLAKKNYFHGLLWHRVIPGFVAQGGDPTGTGTGGPGYQFTDEPVVGQYTAGTVAMANKGANTNGSQFFIILEDQPGLPKSYTIFGHVTSGMDVVKKIVQGDTMDTVVVQDAK